MKTFLNKQREILAIFFYIVFIAGLIYLVILPLITRIADMGNQIQQENAKQESARKHINELPKIQKQFQDLQSKNDLMNILLNNDRAVVLIEKLEKLAASTNNQITISVKDNTASKSIPAKKTETTTKTLVELLPNPDYLQMKISLDGDYNSIVKFVRLLEKFEYYADIIAIRINKSDIATSKEIMLGNSSGVVSTDNSVSSENIVSDKLTAALDVVFYTN